MPVPKFPASSLGFTLIELLVTIGILIILLASSIAGFIRFSDNQKVFTAAKETQQLMRLAQSKAASRVSPPVTSVCDENFIASGNHTRSLQGYRVRLSSATFNIRPLCSQFRTSLNEDTTVIDSYTLPTGVTVAGNATVDFYTLEGGGTAATYTFTATNTGRQYRFSVTATGVVTDVIRL